MAVGACAVVRRWWILIGCSCASGLRMVSGGVSHVSPVGEIRCSEMNIRVLDLSDALVVMKAMIAMSLLKLTNSQNVSEMWDEMVSKEMWDEMVSKLKDQIDGPF